MLARDVMTVPVVTVRQDTAVKEIARLLLDHHIGAVPVVDDKGEVVGIVSDGDLLHRVEAGTERKRSRWLRLLTTDAQLADEYVKSHGRRALDVMTKKVITAAPNAALHEIAALLEKNAIKRMPIEENSQLVGIVSRADLIREVAADRKGLQVSHSDASIRERLQKHLEEQSWTHVGAIGVTVVDGVVTLWGAAGSEAEREAVRVAAENTPGVRAVNLNVTIIPLVPEVYSS
jgi:CBS-domain-containing membrane protein